METKIVGQQKALEGLNFEEQIEGSLNNSNNFIKWAGINTLETGLFYHYFQYIMNAIGLKYSKSMKQVSATRKIPALPTGGNPKADVLLTIEYIDGTKNNITFSCKRTSAGWVSIHEYPISKFIGVLGINDTKLIVALEKLQEVGGIKALKAIDNNYVEYLEKKLPYYNKTLALWAYGGNGGDGDPNTQWAQYIIIYKNTSSDFKIYELEKYIKEIIKVEGQFGTPFTWTYPSGGKSKRVQLKGKIL